MKINHEDLLIYTGTLGAITLDQINTMMPIVVGIPTAIYTCCRIWSWAKEQGWVGRPPTILL